MKKYKIWINIEMQGEEPGVYHNLDEHLESIGPEFILLDHAVTLKNALVDVARTIEKQLGQNYVQHVQDCLEKEWERRGQ